MEKFKLNIRKNREEIDVSRLNSDRLKIIFRLKALYKNENIEGKVSFHISISNNKPKIRNLTIYNLEFETSNSKSSSSYHNPYTLSSSILDSSSDKSSKYTQIYDSIRKFIQNIMIKKNNNKINTIYFSLTNSDITKMNLRGVVINLSNN